MEKHHRLKNLDLFITLSHHMSMEVPEIQFGIIKSYELILSFLELSIYICCMENNS